MLTKMLDEAKAGEELKTTASDVNSGKVGVEEEEAEGMDTTVKSEHSSTTYKNRHGNYPKWMSRKKVAKLKVVKKTKSKAKKKKQGF